MFSYKDNWEIVIDRNRSYANNAASKLLGSIG